MLDTYYNNAERYEGGKKNKSSTRGVFWKLNYFKEHLQNLNYLKDATNYTLFFYSVI